MATATNPMQRPEFVSVDDGYYCNYCKEVLIEALQTHCGHRICAPCFEDLLQNADSVPCPAQEEECVLLGIDKISKDFSARRAIMNLMVHCPNRQYGCQHTMTWKEYLNTPEHLSQCTFRPSKCPNKGCTFLGTEQQLQEHALECKLCDYCDKVFPSQKLYSEHVDMCLNQPKPCEYSVFGCDYIGISDALQRHTKESLDRHVLLLAKHNRKLERDIKDNQQENARLEGSFLEMLSELESKVDALMKYVAQLEKKDKEERKRENVYLKGLFDEKFSEFQNKYSCLENYRVTELDNKKKFVNLSEMLITHTEAFKQFKKYVQQILLAGSGAASNQNVNTMMEQILEQTSLHDREIGVHDVRLAEIDTQLTSLETRCHDGKFIWKITNYSKLRANAKSSKQLSIYSQPFYNSRFGYKMCGRIYPNGDGDGKGTHMSLFFVIMKGEYDNILSWPFRYRVTMTMINQLTHKNNVSDTFMADPGSVSFGKPTSEMNIATGCPCFVIQQHLDDSPYLVDDTMFLEIAITDK